MSYWIPNPSRVLEYQNGIDFKSEKRISSVIGFEPSPIWDGDELMAVELSWKGGKWIIDKRILSSKNGFEPIITLTPDPLPGVKWQISLVNSLFPGTQIPADLLCNLKKNIQDGMDESWTIAFHLVGIDGSPYDGEVDLESWLRGLWSIGSNLNISQPLDVCLLDEHSKISVKGIGNWSLSKDWNLLFARSNTNDDLEIIINIPEGNIISDNLNVRLLKKEEGGMASPPLDKKCLLSVTRGGNQWRILPSLNYLPIGIIQTNITNSFDLINVEAGEYDDDTSIKIFVTTNLNSDKIFLLPHTSRIRDLNNDNFRLKLAYCHYVINFAINQRYWFSHIKDTLDDPNCMVINGSLIQISDDPDKCCFEASQSLDTVRCEPLLHRFLPDQLNEIDILESISIENKVNDVRKLKFISRPPAGGETVHEWGIATGEASNDFRIFSLPGAVNFSGNIHDFEFDILRPDDLLWLKFLFFNFTFEIEDGRPYLTKLVSEDRERDAYMSVQFNNPQHVAESVEDTPFVTETQIRKCSYASGPSWLGFRLKKDLPENFKLEFTLQNLLNWDEYFENHNAGIDRNPSMKKVVPEAFSINPPNKTQTTIEAPWRLFISPVHDVKWINVSSNAKKHNNTYEIWHTKLKPNGNETDENGGEVIPKVRAIWSSEFDGKDGDYCDRSLGEDLLLDTESSFATTLNSKNRTDIVKLSSCSYPSQPDPKPIDAHVLMLSSVGAWLDLRGSWDNQTFDLRKWEHRSTMGRDHFVKVETVGNCFFSGHELVIIKTYERTFKKVSVDGLNQYVAVVSHVRTQMQLPNPEVSYLYLDNMSDGGRYLREFVFTSLRFNEPSVVDIANPPLDHSGGDESQDTSGTNVYGSGENSQMFFPRRSEPGSSNKKYYFKMRGKDRMGRVIDFSCPLLYVSREVWQNKDSLQAAMDFYRTFKKERTISMTNQTIAFADSGINGDRTSFPTFEITVHVNKIPTTPPLPLLPYYPVLDMTDRSPAKIIIPTIERIQNQSRGFTENTAIVPVTFNHKYLQRGFEPSPGEKSGEVFLEVKEVQKVDFSKSSEKSGGLLTPNLSVSGLSRTFGTVSGSIDKFENGEFDPLEYFGGLDARLFGQIQLTDIILGYDNVLNEIGENIVPKVITINEKGTITTTFHWSPYLKTLKLGNFLVLDYYPKRLNGYDEQHPAKDYLDLDVKIVTKKNSRSEVTVNGMMRRFSIDLFNMVQINFEKIHFNSESKKKMQVDVTLSSEGGDNAEAQTPFEFKGQLSFVNSLKDFIPPNGFQIGGQTGPFVKVSGSHISLGYTLPIPSIAMGAFTIENIKLLSSFELPLNNAPLMFRFAFCTREEPFYATVAMLGGGGFFGLAIGSKGIEIIEFLLEFGARSTMNFAGIASGCLHMMVGIYMKFTGERDPPITGTFEAYGRLSVLGMVSASVGFLLSLTYVPEKSLITGEATVYVRINTFFFKKTQGITLKQSWYTGENQGQMNVINNQSNFSFEKLMTKRDWVQYWEAFED